MASRRKRLPPEPHMPALVHDSVDPIKNSSDVFYRVRPEIRNAEDEYFCVIGMNTRNRVVFHHVQAKGGMDECVVRPREVFRDLLRAGACTAILVHNHPSGDVDPSPQDKLLTMRMAEAGRIIGLRVVDHIIVSGDKWWSARDEGAL